MPWQNAQSHIVDVNDRKTSYMKSASIQSGEVTWGSLTNSLFTRSNIRVLEFLVAQSHHVVAGPDMTHSMFDTCLGGCRLVSHSTVFTSTTSIYNLGERETSWLLYIVVLSFQFYVFIYFTSNIMSNKWYYP
jgi:hypothetical protein